MSRIFLSFGPINIYWYSVILLIAISAAIYVSYREAKKYKMDTYIENLIFEVIILGIIGARLYYVVFNFSAYKNNILDIFKVWEGGLAIYGGLIGGFIGICLNAKKNGQSIIKTTDILFPGVILGQAIGRWGNFFNMEAHGGAVSLSLLKKMHIPKFIIDGMYINGIYYHPTFLYESIWCLLGFIILLLIRKRIKGKKGIITYSYFVWYGIGRFFIEGLRTDSLYIGSCRVSQLVSVILVIVGIYGIIKNRK